MTSLGTVLDHRMKDSGICGDALRAVKVWPQAAAVVGTGEEFAAARAALELAIAEGRSHQMVIGRYERLQRVAAARARVTGVDVDALHCIYERAQHAAAQQRRQLLAEMEAADAE